MGGLFVKGLVELESAPQIRVGATPRELVFTEGLAKLYHYSAEHTPKSKYPLLIVYALVNRPGMLDLQPERSFIARLLAEGLDVYLLEWSDPARAEQHYGLEDYILGDLHGCVNYLRKRTKTDQIHLAGVCQGGTFAVIYGSLYPGICRTLTTFVSPIDYQTDDGLLFAWAKNLPAEKINATYGIVPARFMMASFELLRPFSKMAKYVDMLHWSEEEKRISNFLHLEQWIYDGPPLAGRAFQQTINWLYKENQLANGTFELEGRRVSLKKITCPVLTVFAEQDHIVPPAATRPLNKLVGSKDTEMMAFPGGHIGLFVSQRTQIELAPSVARWILQREVL